MAARVGELGAELARDYADREPLLIGSLKACIPFICDLSRALPVHHALDFVELSGYGRSEQEHGVRFLKDTALEVRGRHVVLVDEVVDTGLTMNYLARTLALREPATLAAVTLFDRPYRRLVDDLPVRYVGFTIPDEFFVGYGFGLDERWRNLPDLHLVRA
ncbi:MAG TPA: phosphoribosyltransferase family protein [Gaiellaceae bacterium]|nr:phosphoribosyltransferase family protein [Gaiellaceae bacterium]